MNQRIIRNPQEPEDFQFGWVKVSGKPIENVTDGRVKLVHIQRKPHENASNKVMAILKATEPPYEHEGDVLNEVSIKGNIHHVVIREDDYDTAAKYINQYQSAIDFCQGINHETQAN